MQYMFPKCFSCLNVNVLILLSLSIISNVAMASSVHELNTNNEYNYNYIHKDDSLKNIAVSSLISDTNFISVIRQQLQVIAAIPNKNYADLQKQGQSSLGIINDESKAKEYVQLLGFNNLDSFMAYEDSKAKVLGGLLKKYNVKVQDLLLVIDSIAEIQMQNYFGKDLSAVCVVEAYRTMLQQAYFTALLNTQTNMASLMGIKGSFSGVAYYKLAINFLVTTMHDFEMCSTEGLIIKDGVVYLPSLGSVVDF
jgi:hypothetical protein